MGRTKLLTTYNGHGQSGWSPVACEGLYFHPVCENRVSVSGWSPIACEGLYFHPVCENRVSVSGWSPIVVKVFAQIWTSQVHSILLSSSTNFVGYSYISYIYIYNYIHTYIWVNYNISLTWILRSFGDDFPKINHDSQWGRTVRSWWNLPRYYVLCIIIMYYYYYYYYYIHIHIYV